MKPQTDGGTGISCSRETGSRKSSSKRGKRLHVSEVGSASPAVSSKSGGGNGRSAGATTAASVIVNMSSVNSASGTSVAKDQVTGSSAGSSGNNWNKQHSSSSSLPFGRFSLRRLLNPVNLTRTAMATTAAAVSSSGRTASSTRAIPVIDSSDIRVSFFPLSFPGSYCISVRCHQL